METRWLYTNSYDFPALREASAYTCLIPMGCVEKHGLHLPLGQDLIQASHIAQMAAQMETVCVFPDFVFGDYSNAAPCQPAGTITLPVETEMLLLEQLCEQISRNGMKKILILNGHDPVGCNERIVKAALWIQAQRMADAFKVFKEDENVLKWHNEMQKGW